MYSVIEKNIKSNGRIVQKRNKGNSLKFQLIPSKAPQDNNSSSQQNSVDKDGDKGPLWLAVFILSVIVVKYIIYMKYIFLPSEEENVMHKRDVETDSDQKAGSF